MSGRSTAVAVLAAVFFAGIASTLAVLRVAEQPGSASVMERPGENRWRGGARPFARPPGALGGPPELLELARTEVAERMAEELGLSDDQRARIEAAMDRARQEAQEAMAEVVPRLRAQMDALQEEIEAVLTDEQRAAYEAFRQRDRDRFRRRGGRPPFSPGIQ